MSLNLFGRRRGKGEILKAERMLVRIEVIDNPNQSLPAEYNEGNIMLSPERLMMNISISCCIFISRGYTPSPWQELPSAFLRSPHCLPSIGSWKGINCSVFLRRCIRIRGRHPAGRSFSILPIQKSVCSPPWTKQLLSTSLNETKASSCSS